MSQEVCSIIDTKLDGGFGYYEPTKPIPKQCENAATMAIAGAGISYAGEPPVQPDTPVIPQRNMPA